MASGPQQPCLWCKSTQHQTRLCASQEDLIDFDEFVQQPKLNKETLTSRDDASISGCATLEHETPAGLSTGKELCFPSSSSALQCRSNPVKDVSSIADVATTLGRDDAFANVLKEATTQRLEDSELIKLASTSAPQPIHLTTNSELDTTGREYVLSEDEADIYTVKKNSLTKVMSWNDGSKKLVVKHVAVRRLQEESTDRVIKAQNSNSNNEPQPLSEVLPTAVTKPQTIQPFKNDPLKGMVTIESTKMSCDTPTSFSLALSGGRQCRKASDKNKTRSTSYAEAVARTPDEVTGMVRVSSLPRKRQGKRGQPSYFNITSELHYLR